LISSTTGTMMATNLMSSQLTLLMSAWKALVPVSVAVACAATAPKKLRAPDLNACRMLRPERDWSGHTLFAKVDDRCTGLTGHSPNAAGAQGSESACPAVDLGHPNSLAAVSTRPVIQSKPMR